MKIKDYFTFILFSPFLLILAAASLVLWMNGLLLLLVPPFWKANGRDTPRRCYEVLKEVQIELRKITGF